MYGEPEKVPKTCRKYSKATREDLRGKVKGTRRLGEGDSGLHVSNLLYSENGGQLLSSTIEAE